ncbi:37S ribosomal protein S28, mitochondrial [Termitomyces sp. J132]|nr:37S ribosomal protein S28, mitochondrial [Termitomyces sp. J132]
MRRGKEGEWEKCLLAKILITEEELGISNELVPTEQTIGTVYLPKQFNFGVGEAEKQLLTGTGDAIPEYVSIESLEEEQNVWRKNIVKEHGKANAFARVIDLRNANAAGIAYENRRRIIEAFSTPQNPFDPGRSEVQGSWIRNLWNHLTTFKRDLGNLRGLRMLVHQRAKILRYLKKVDQNRYEIVLQQLALEPESVEGELVV